MQQKKKRRTRNDKTKDSEETNNCVVVVNKCEMRIEKVLGKFEWNEEENREEKEKRRKIGWREVKRIKGCGGREVVERKTEEKKRRCKKKIKIKVSKKTT